MPPLPNNEHIVATDNTPAPSPLSKQTLLTGNGQSVIVKSLALTYLAPVEFPDVLAIGLRISKPKWMNNPSSSISTSKELPLFDPRNRKDRFIMECIMVSHKTGKISCTAECETVWFDYTRNTRMDVPKEIWNTFSHFENWGVRSKL